jgi:7-cyano-7-deazaguanine synthase in queuosine biosynthesis
MTTVQVRIDAAQPDRGADLLLDWFARDEPASTVAYEPKFMKDLAVGAVARDLLRVAGIVFVADKTVLRSATYDSWTRDFSVSIPVSDPDLWRAAAPLLARTLSFLSGDKWLFTFEALAVEGASELRPAQMALAVQAFDTVCLLSGGLDSLAGAINLLEDGKKPIFVGHHESGKPNKLQGDLVERLVRAYGGGNMALRRLYLAPKYRSARAARPLPPTPETTTRSRSFLFLSAAAGGADAVGPGTPIVMPENGVIGINVPLTNARAGSLSTRTTHPQYVAHMTVLFDQLGLEHAIVNPFRLLTKGEILAQSANPDLLARLGRRSVSCSHAETGRWGKGSTAKDQGNCGACYPCLIRGAAMHHVGWKDAPRRYNPLRRADQHLLLSPAHKTGAAVQAVLDHLRHEPDPLAVLRNGSIPSGEASAFDAVYRRGRHELAAWLGSGRAPLIR